MSRWDLGANQRSKLCTSSADLPRNRGTTPSSDVLVLHITLVKVWTIPATAFSQFCHLNILSGEGSRIVTFFRVNGTLKHEFSPVKHSSLRTGHGNKAYWRQPSFLARSVFNNRCLRKALCHVWWFKFMFDSKSTSMNIKMDQWFLNVLKLIIICGDTNSSTSWNITWDQPLLSFRLVNKIPASKARPSNEKMHKSW